MHYSEHLYRPCTSRLAGSDLDHIVSTEYAPWIHHSTSHRDVDPSVQQLLDVEDVSNTEETVSNDLEPIL